MMKKHSIFLIIIFLVVILFVCLKTNLKMGITTANLNVKASKYELSRELYKENNIEAYYPQIISGASELKIAELNDIIKKDFDKILKIYSFNPYPDLEPTPIDKKNMIILLYIDYQIKLNDGKYLSIYYKANYNSKYSAHPSELIYTTNVDLINSKRLRLENLVDIDKDFVKSFREWEFHTFEMGNPEWNEAINEYMKGIDEKELLDGLKSADLIGMDNLWGIFSYMTEDKLGISVSVPHFIGDHVEFERNYSDIPQIIITP